MSSIEQAMRDMDDYGTVQGECTRCGCDVTVEPDCTDGYCDNCKSNSVVSPLVTAGLI